MNITRLQFTISINASAAVVWECLWGKENYKIWTAPFCEGSYYSGEMIEGNRVHLLTPEGHGMYSNVAKRVENSILEFNHIGDIKDFKEVPLDEKSSLWSGALEGYYLEELNGITQLRVEVDTVPQYVDFMNTAFPKALETLKHIATN